MANVFQEMALYPAVAPLDIQVLDVKLIYGLAGAIPVFEVENVLMNWEMGFPANVALVTEGLAVKRRSSNAMQSLVKTEEYANMLSKMARLSSNADAKVVMEARFASIIMVCFQLYILYNSVFV